MSRRPSPSSRPARKGGAVIEGRASNYVLLGSALLTPIAILLSLSDDTYFWAKVFFPFNMLWDRLWGGPPIPLIVFACIQIPLYGILIAWDAERPRRKVAVAIACVHAAAVAAGFLFPEYP